MHRDRCFIHLANALVWRAITGEAPPTVPFTSAEYTRAGLPWFEYYGADQSLGGGAKLTGIQSVKTLGKEKGSVPLPENESVDPKKVVKLGVPKWGQVRQGEF